MMLSVVILSCQIYFEPMAITIYNIIDSDLLKKVGIRVIISRAIDSLTEFGLLVPDRASPEIFGLLENERDAINIID